MDILKNEVILTNVILLTEYEELVKIDNVSNDHPFRDFLNSKYTIRMLCEKYELKVVDTFALFSRNFLKKHFFSDHVNDETRKSNYKKTYLSVADCLSKACDTGYWEFADYLFSTEKLCKSHYHLRILAMKCCADHEKFKRISQQDKLTYTSDVLKILFKNKASDENIRSYIEAYTTEDGSFVLISLIVGHGRWGLADYIEDESIESILCCAVNCDNVELLESRDIPQNIIDKIEPNGLDILDRTRIIAGACEYGSIKVLDYIGATCEEVEICLEYNSNSGVYLWYLEHGGDFSKIFPEDQIYFDLKLVKYLRKKSLMPEVFHICPNLQTDCYKLVAYIHNKVIDTKIAIQKKDQKQAVYINVEFRRFQKRLEK